MWSCRGIFCFFNTFSHIYFWKMIPTYDVDTVEIKDVSSMNKKEKNSYFSDLKKKFQRSIVAQTIDIAKHNEGAKELEFKVEKDGKVIDYANPPLKKESDFNAYRSVSFLRRSNEIKELLKKKQKEVFGVTVFDKEVRYCDVDSYDPLFDIVTIPKKSYSNLTDKDDYVKKHPTDSCKAQLAFSDITTKEYDALGFECYDDYFDIRRRYFSDWKRAPFQLTNSVRECGIAGCIFRCIDNYDMEEHKKLHDAPRRYRCLEEKCFHSCDSRVDLKHHMLQHCKHLYPCLKSGCRSVFTVPVEFTTHYTRHYHGHMPYQKRRFCHLCRKLVMHYNYHKRIHPEITIKCPYPGCITVLSSDKHYAKHRLYHKICDDIKRMQQK